MSQEKHPIDSLFSPLRNESSEVPDHIWPNVHSAIRQNKRRRGYWYWLIPVLLLGILVAGLVFNKMNQSDISSEKLPIASESNEKKSTKSSTLNKDHLSEQDPGINEKKNGPVYPVNSVSKSTNNADIKTDLQKASLKKEAISSSMQPIDDQLNIQFSTPGTGPLVAASESDVPNIGRAAILNMINPLQKLSPVIQGGGSDHSDLFKMDTDRDCYRFTPRESSFYMDLYIAPEYAFKSMEPRTFEADTYIDEREATESFNYAFSAGLRASYIHYSGITVRAGLNYSQIAEIFDYVNANSERTIIDVERDANGNIISIDTTIVTGTRVKTTYNRFHLIDLPLSVGYHFGGDKLHFAITGGAAVNLLFFRKGDILDPNLEPVTISSGDDIGFQAFEETLGLSLIGGLGAYYELGEKTQLMLEPEFRYFLNSFTLQSYSIDQRYWNVGLAIGIRIKI